MNNFTVLRRCKTGKHLYCQDYSKVLCSDDAITVLIADGHGGVPYCRSSLGARFAVFAAAKLLSQGVPVESFPAAVKDEFDRLVAKHLAFHPLSAAEQKLLKDKPAIEAYGTTLLGLRITSEGKTESFQLGDGEIHVVARTGNFISVLPPDPDCYLNRTSSLCQDRQHVISHFRTAVLNEFPAAIAMYTDGYEANAPYPWKPVCLTLGGSITEEKLDAVLDQHKSADDRTFVLVYDHVLSRDPEYTNALMSTMALLAQYEKLRQLKHQLIEEYESLETYLSIAQNKAKRFHNRECKEYKEFVAKRERKQIRFNEIKELLNRLP